MDYKEVCKGKMFTKLWHVFKLTWIERMAYRVNFMLEILSGIVSALIIVFLWLAVYKSSGSTNIGGYTIQEMITYLLGSGLINTFILTTAENPETSRSIQEGTLSGLLIKPLSPYAIWFIRDMGTKAFLLSIGLVGYVAVFFFFRNYVVFPLTSTMCGLFILSLVLAALLQFLIFEVLSLLAFWVENTYGIRFVMRVIMEVVGGAIIPLSFFPLIVQKIFLLFPFHYLIYLPMRIYLAKIDASQILVELLKECGWILTLTLVNAVIWKKGVRQYVAMGD